MKTAFEQLADKVAERLAEALVEVKTGNPTDAMRTLETARAEVLHAKKTHQLVRQLEFWK